MSGNSNCAECSQLWREYSKATQHHIDLEGKLRLARLSHDPATIQKLSPLVEDAALERVARRSAILAHDREAHGRSDIISP